jgi:hypothetical protein
MGIPQYNTSKAIAQFRPGPGASNCLPTSSQDFGNFLNFYQNWGDPTRRKDMQPKSFQDDIRQSTLNDHTMLLERIVLQLVTLQQVITGAAFFVIVCLLLIFFRL